MKPIITIICIMAGALVIIALYSVNRQKFYLDTYSQELKNRLEEAKSVKSDLEDILTNTVNISRHIVDDLDDRLVDETTGKIKSLSFEPGCRKDEPSDRDRLTESKVRPVAPCRVHELAADLGIGSRTLIDILQGWGIEVTHHMNILETDTSNMVRMRLTEGNYCHIPDCDQDLMAMRADKVQSEKTYHSGPITEKMKEIFPCLQRQKNLVEPDHSNTEYSLDEIRAAHPYIAVRTLWEKGLTVREIAEFLNCGQGEVSLILNLIKKKRA